MTFALAAGAAVVAAASFVQGLAGFGIGLVSLAVLPFLVTPTDAVVLMTLYAAVFCGVILVPLRRDFQLVGVDMLVVGSVLGTPLGVWVLATVSGPVLARLIGLALVLVVALEWSGRSPRRLPGRAWGLAAGVLSGVAGGAVGTPGPPAIVYMAAQGWSARTVKANLQAFLVVNQLVILVGYWWAGLLTPAVWRLAAVFALPALVGLLAGMRLFDRIDAVKFRRIVFAVLLASGVALLLRG
ncbi:MAG TPA: sulfite exporter TauE/SafE family protein [Methylomirabilota bacterium]|nr:sulfite exporter TauE/SafE family protein [Methylomirabilota bacterium]